VTRSSRPDPRPGRTGGQLSCVLGLLVVSLLGVAPVAAQEAPSEAPVQLVEPVVPAGWPRPPAVEAETFVVVDASTGQVLADVGADVRRPVASTVKLLTALTVLRHARPSEVVEVDAAAAAVGGAGVGLRPGQRWSVEELVAAMLVRSGNDAATALAVHVGGSVPGFVAMMEAEATALGLDGVVLRDPTGLDDRTRMSARDLAVLGRAALAEPTIARLSALESFGLPGRRGMPNRNELVGRYPGATGLKTGFTDAAGYALVASATRDGRDLVAVVLGAPSDEARFTAASQLLDHGFGAFTVSEVGVSLGLRVTGATVPVTSGTLPLTLPVVAPRAGVETFLPVELPPAGTRVEVGVGWETTTLGTVPVEVGSDPRPPVVGGAAARRWLGDRLHASLRAATRAGLWDTSAATGR
jgi:serine-type D-Ala-D-Ala carboxypeptidase (penicillin-binding protein 5/6)